MENLLMETALIPVEIQEKINQEIVSLVQGTSSISVIENNPQHENAVALTKSIKTLAKSLEDERDALVRPKNNEVKEINLWFKNPQEKLESLEKSLKRAIFAYQQKMEQIRLEEQRKRDEEARKEREKIEAQARAQREKEDAARRAEEEARQRQAAAKRAQEEAEQRAREAVNAEARKKAQEEAEQARKESERAAREELVAKQKADAASSAAALKENVAELVVAVAVAPKMEKQAGVSMAVTYSGNIIDKGAAIKFCLENNKLHLVDLNMAVINKMVIAEKENFLMPGIEVIKKEDLRIRK
jgi:membrane protein involved in colicin uptake